MKFGSGAPGLAAAAREKPSVQRHSASHVGRFVPSRFRSVGGHGCAHDRAAGHRREPLTLLISAFIAFSFAPSDVLRLLLCFAAGLLDGGDYAGGVERPAVALRKRARRLRPGAQLLYLWSAEARPGQ